MNPSFTSTSQIKLTLNAKKMQNYYEKYPYMETTFTV